LSFLQRHVPEHEMMHITEVCDRLEGSIERVAAILYGDIQEAKAWLSKYQDVLAENATLKCKVIGLQKQLDALQKTTV